MTKSTSILLLRHSVPILFLISQALFLYIVESTIIITSESTHESFEDRIAAFGPRISSEGIEGYVVNVESLEPVGQAVNEQPVYISNAQNDLDRKLESVIDDNDRIISPSQSSFNSPEEDVSSPVLPSHGCSFRKPPTWINSNDTWIALVERGGCSFIDKVRFMQSSGASAVIVGNNELSSRLLTMYAGGDTSDVVIPSTFIKTWSYSDLRSIIKFEEHYERNDQQEQLPLMGVEEVKDGIRRVRVRILPSNDFNWPLMDIIVITVVAPLIILVFLFSLWRFRQRRMIHITDEERVPLLGLLTQDDLSQLHIKSFDPDNIVPPECEACAICLDDFELDEEVRLLRCGHTFHCKCVDTWLTSRRGFCPICKSNAHPSQTDHEDEFDSENIINSPLIPARASSLVPLYEADEHPQDNSEPANDLFISVPERSTNENGHNQEASNSSSWKLSRWFGRPSTSSG